MKEKTDQLLPFDWEGKLVRLTMPNPTADTTDSGNRPAIGAASVYAGPGGSGGESDGRPTASSGSGGPIDSGFGAEDDVRLEQWDGWPRWASPEFGVVNPYHM